jgi:hypothetical protein
MWNNVNRALEAEILSNEIKIISRFTKNGTDSLKLIKKIARASKRQIKSFTFLLTDVLAVIGLKFTFYM